MQRFRRMQSLQKFASVLAEWRDLFAALGTAPLFLWRLVLIGLTPRSGCVHISCYKKGEWSDRRKCRWSGFEETLRERRRDRSDRGPVD